MNPLKCLFSGVFSLVFFLVSNAQQAYWQQEVNYSIDVSLDDVNHRLSGYIDMEYINHSPDVLREIYIHLWPNAYKNLNTAYARQELENGSTRFYFSEESDRGYIDKLDFKVDGAQVKWALDSVDVDIARIELAEPLKPGTGITISTPFEVKIPASFSRLGHVGQSYQITQWYPKPAVYDKDGWQAMPYLDQGEFYSDYGSFDVRITLPRNYVVGASGDLMTASEKKWLDSLAAATEKLELEDFDASGDFPPSDSVTKTIRYTLDEVHDFAWFADKRYYVKKGEVKLPNSGRKVTTWAMFPGTEAEMWEDAIEYINDGTYYYSLWLGDYPYAVVTAVDGALSAGAGMEYPTITVVGGAPNKLTHEVTIVHEVGHNWFYGIFGTNERLHPWMDEGLNSYYESRYVRTKYPDKKLLDGSRALSRLFDLESYHWTYQQELYYTLCARLNYDQPIRLRSEEFTSYNYGAIVYAKSAVAFRHLAAVLGEGRFDEIMQQYFKKWQIKHPAPEDFRHHFESTEGKQMDWFFDDVMTTDEKMDYAITKVKKQDDGYALKVRNRLNIAAPFSVSAMYRDSVVSTIQYNGVPKDTSLVFPAGNYTAFRLDANRESLDIRRKNNTIRTRGFLRKTEPVRFQLLGSVENPYRNQLFFTPVAGWNNYDKTMIGLAFYNHTLPFKKFQYELVPMLGTASLQLTGLGKVGYTWLPRVGAAQSMTLNVYGRRFSYALTPDILTYSKIQPELSVRFRPSYARSSVEQGISLRSVTVFQDYRQYNTDIAAYERTTGIYTVNELSYWLKDGRAINYYDLSLHMEQGPDYGKAFGELNYFLTYNKRRKGLDMRLFGGAFLWNNNTELLPDARFRLNYSTGIGLLQKDYLFDELYLGRSETQGIFAQQNAERDGGFHSLTSQGQTDKWLAALHLNTTIPGKLPLRPYLGMAAFGQQANEFNLAFEGGILLSIWPEIFEVSFPLFSIVQTTTLAGDKQTFSWSIGKADADADNLFSGKKYAELISFRLNLARLNPFPVMDNFARQ